MNDVYGIDPESPAYFRDFAHLMRLFDVDQGRFIARYPESWVTLLRNHLSAISDLEKAKFTEQWLDIGQSALVPASSKKFTAKWGWEQNAAVEIQSNVTKLIGKRGCSPALAPIDEELLNADAFPDGKGRQVKRTVADYVNVARPLLQTSPKLALIDPYFKLRYKIEGTDRWGTTRQYEVLKQFVSEAAKWGRVENILLCVNKAQALVDDDDGAFFGDLLCKILDELNVSSIQFEWRELDPSFSEERHPRYLLGMNRGLHFDWGFDFDSKSSTTNHVQWIGKAVLEPLLRRFM